MHSKTKPPPLRTYKNFFKALRLAQDKYGFKFEFVQAYAEVWDDEGWAYNNMIWHRSKAGSFWGPVEVVHHVFFSPDKRLWMPHEMAYSEIGLPQQKYKELVLAYREARGHLISLRARMCDVLGLKEVPVNERGTYRTVDEMDKRRR